MRYYDVTMLLDILHGTESKRVLDARLNYIPEFGNLKNIARDKLQLIVEWLLENHYMLKTKGQYPTLHPTYEGMHYGESMTAAKLKKLKKYLEEEVVLR